MGLWIQVAFKVSGWVTHPPLIHYACLRWFKIEFTPAGGKDSLEQITRAESGSWFLSSVGSWMLKTGFASGEGWRAGTHSSCFLSPVLRLPFFRIFFLPRPFLWRLNVPSPSQLELQPHSQEGNVWDCGSSLVDSPPKRTQLEAAGSGLCPSFPQPWS